MEKGAAIQQLIVDVREHLLYMQELGVEAIDADIPPEVQNDHKIATPLRRNEATEIPVSAPEVIINRPIIRASVPGARIASLPSLLNRSKHPDAEISGPQNQHSSMIDPISDNGPEILMEAETRSTTPISDGIVSEADSIERIRAEIGDCTRCKLHALGRKQIVHTTGNFDAELMFVGEAPGADEDEKGFPFVGRAGQLLTKIIESIGFRRENVCIGNINRCRPPGNRQPEPDETAQCRPFILREIAIVRPKVIVVLGATAAHNLLQVKTPISRLRGNFHDYFGVKVMPTFHPAYLLRDPRKKREVWEDMKMVRDFIK